MAKTRKPHPTDAVADYLWERDGVPADLWHYTDAKGMLGIAKGKTLWCSEYRYLNDRNEIAVFAQSMQGHLNEELGQYLSASDSKKAIEATTLYTTWNVFICSLCADADRNEHWHQYAKKAGYALGFNPQLLRTLAQSQGYTLGRVIYGEEHAKNIALAVLKDKLTALKRFKSPLSNDELNVVSSFLCRLILSYAPFFKPLSFERENEWRLVKLTGIAGNGAVQFRSSDSFGLLGYHEFQLSNVGRRGSKKIADASSQLIPHILIGPGNETDGWLSASNVYELFKQNGFSPLVSESASSLRF